MTGAVPRVARIAVNLLHVVPGAVGGSEEYAVRTLLAYARHGSPDLAPVLHVLAPFVAAHRPLCEAFDTVVCPLDGGNRARRILAELTWLVARTADVDAVRMFVSMGLIRGLTIFVTIGTFGGLMLVTNWRLGLVSMAFVPIVLVLRQPDLGTAVMLGIGAAAVFFVAGTALKYFVMGGALALAAIPTVWQFLEGYQRDRILTFLNPDADPLGSGYHILQSKIALGSGGLLGRGYMQGTQSHLSFLPEHQTDFIFTMLAEEFGLVGGLFVILLFGIIIGYGYVISFYINPLRVNVFHKYQTI